MHLQNKNPRHLLHRVMAFLLLSLLCGCKAAPESNQTARDAGLPPVVAMVGDRAISTKLYEMYLKNGQAELGIDPSTEEGKRKLELLREGIVSELIDRVLIAQEAERRNLNLTPEEMTEAERRAISQFGGDKAYDDYLAQHRLSRDEYRDVIRWEVYGRKLREDLFKGLDVAAEDVKKYYDEHKGDAAFQLPERITAAHILVAARPNVISQQLAREQNLSGDALERAVREEVARRRARAEELRRRAAAGADFAQLARETSDDPSSREQGGDLGTFTQNSHPKAFDDAAFATRPGAVSPVVETDFGFHIIKVKAHENPRTQSLEEATPEIRRRLLAEREAVRLKEWLVEARRQGRVRVSEPFRFGSLRTEFPAM